MPQPLSEPLPDAIEMPVWEELRRESDIAEGPAERSVLRRDALFRRALAVADAAGAAAALVVSIAVLEPGGASLRPAAVLVLPVVVLIAKAMGLYDRDQHLVRKSSIDEGPRVLHMALLTAAIVWLGEGLFVSGRLEREEVLSLTILGCAATMLARAGARRAVLAFSRPERCLVLGNAGIAAQVEAKLRDATSSKTIVVGRVALDDGQYGDAHGGPPLLGGVDLLGLFLAEHEVERVIIAPDGHDQEDVLHAIRLVKALGAKVSVLPRLLEVVGSASVFDDLGGLTLLGIRHYGLSRSSEALKRATDLVIVGAATVFLAPLLALLAVAVKIDSRGPVFFRQRRVGRNGREFHMLKFRSMVPNAEAMKDALRPSNESDGLFKIGDDPRITRAGRFLRRTSLDELPQLLNVLRGDMSLVGPRPLVCDEDAMIEGWQRRRLAVKPGITGLWQIFGSFRIPMREMVKIDYMYGANWSLWLDMKILFRTVPYVLGRRGR